MKNTTILSVLMTLTLSAFMSCQPSTAQQSSKISTTDLYDKINNKEELQIIDVRTPEEVSYGKVPTAVNIDFYDAEFLKKMDALDKNKPVVVYCAVGGRSGKAANQIKSLGFTQIYDLTGGYRQWASESLPAEK